MPTERLNESIARKKELIKSSHAKWKSASKDAKAHAAAMPLHKSAAEDSTAFFISFFRVRVMARATLIRQLYQGRASPATAF
jgi:hypothetical protein